MSKQQEIAQAYAGPNGIAKTLLLIAWNVCALLFIYFALKFGPGDNQLIRLGLWCGGLLSIALTLRMLVVTLREYNLRLWRLPSTWMTVGALILVPFYFFIFPHIVILAGFCTS